MLLNSASFARLNTMFGLRIRSFQVILFLVTPLVLQNIAFALALEGKRPSRLLASSSLSHCAILKTGEVNCWGLNDGNGVPLGSGFAGNSNVGVLVSGIDNAVSIAGGYSHFCAALVDGTVKCWGDNTYGQLGNGTSGNYSSVPVVVSGLSNVKKIAVGLDTNYVLLADGSMRSWGYGAQGQLGNGTNTTIQSTPVTIAASTIVDISAGSDVACTVTVSGAVSCWGISSLSFPGSNTPTIIGGISNAKSIDVQDTGAGFSACALLNNGTVKCWGSNAYGNLGLGTADSSAHTTPTTIPSFSDIVELSIGSHRNGACAIKANNRNLYCWGVNIYGQLGDGTTTDRYSPTLVSGTSNRVLAVSSSLASTCALLVNGTVECTGYGPLGAMGNGSNSSRTAFGSGVMLTSQASIGPKVVTSSGHSCGMTSTGTLRCWGLNSDGQLGDGTSTNRTSPVATSPLYTNAIDVSLGASHSCAMLADGTAQCWGANASGQLGDNTTTSSTIPRDVFGLLGYKGISISASDNDSTCALLADGSIRCWGFNSFGQLGDGTTTNRSAPVAVTGLAEAEFITQGGFHSCAINSSGNVVCWGHNGWGQLGDGTLNASSVPVTALATNSIAVTAGTNHTCSLGSNGRVQCWGENGYGQIGNGSLGGWSMNPVFVLTAPGVQLQNVVAISSSSYTTCALIADGTTKCWGANFDGELGTGSATPAKSGYALSSIGINVTSVSGSQTTCSTKVNGQVWCWGLNTYGQVGNGITSSSEVTPLQIGGFPY